MELTSSAFESGAPIPSHYTCDGAGVNPPLAISGVPDGAQSLALLVEDPDVPRQLKPDGIFDHWVLFNIPPGVTEISENITAESAPGIRGKNGRGALNFMGPCPPPQFEPQEHRYIFTLYALDNELDLSEGATKEEVLDAMKRGEGHIIETCQLVGKYRRQ